jgi:flagellar protein FliO/FliZ
MLPNTHSMLLAAAALAAVLGLIFLVQRLVRAGGLLPRNTGARLAVAEVIALDPRRRLHLVRCDGRHLLLLTGGPQDLSLGWLAEQERAP